MTPPLNDFLDRFEIIHSDDALVNWLLRIGQEAQHYERLARDNGHTEIADRIAAAGAEITKALAECAASTIRLHDS